MDKYDKLVDLAKRRGFFWQSFEIYGGVSGFIDFGPLGTMLKRRIEERIKGIRVVVYHSYLSSGRRTLEWLKAVEGKTDVLVGTRSALFVPVKWDLIVIDEINVAVSWKLLPLEKQLELKNS